MASYGNVPTAEFKHTHHQTITSPSSWVSSMQSLLMIYICFIALSSSFFVRFALFCFAAFVRLSRALVSHSQWDLISLIMHKYVQSSTIVTASGSFIHWPLCDFLFWFIVSLLCRATHFNFRTIPTEIHLSRRLVNQQSFIAKTKKKKKKF